MVIVWVTWVFFRAPGMDAALTLCGRMFGLSAASGAGGAGGAQLRLESDRAVHGAVTAGAASGRFAARGTKRWARTPALLRGSVYAACVVALMMFGGSTQRFIYFDF